MAGSRWTASNISLKTQKAADIKVDDVLNKVLAKDSVLSLSRKKNDASDSAMKSSFKPSLDDLDNLLSDIENDIKLANDPITDQNLSQEISLKPSGDNVSETLSTSNSLISELNPANDIRHTPFAPLQSFKKTKFSKRYWGTTALTAAWMFSGAVIARCLSTTSLNSLSSIRDFFFTESGFLISLTTLAPLPVFWAFSCLSQRTKEMELIAKTMSEATRYLAQPEALVTECLSDLNKKIRTEILGNEARIRSMLNDLVQERRLVMNQAQRVQASIEQTKENFKESFQLNGKHITQDMSLVQEQLKQLLHNSRESITQDIQEITNSVFSSMDERLKYFSEQLNDKGVRFSEILDSQIRDVTEKSLGMIQSEGEVLSNNLVQLAENTTGVFSENIHKVCSELQVNVDTALSAFEKQSYHLSETAHHHASKVISELDSQTKDCVKNVSEMYKDLKDCTLDLCNNVNASSQNLSNVLSSEQESFSQIFELNIEKMAERNSHQIESALKTHDQLLSERLDEINHTVRSGEKTFSDLLFKQNSAIQEAVANSDQIVQSQLLSHLTELEKKTYDLRESWVESGNRLIHSIENRMSFLADSLSNNRNAFSEAFTHQEEVLAKSTAFLKEAFSTQESLIQTGRHSVQSALDHSQSLFKDSISEHISEIESQFGSMDTHLLEKMNVVQENIEATVEVVSEQLDEKLLDSINKIAHRTEQASTILKRFDDHSSTQLTNVLGQVEERLSDVSNTFSSNLTSRSEEVLNAFNNVGIELRKELDHAQGIFSELTDSVKENFSEKRTILEETTVGLITDIEKATEQFDRAGDRMISKMHDSFLDGERHLNEHVLQMNSVYENFDKNIQTLSSKASQILDDKILNLNELISTRSQDISRIVDKACHPLIETVSHIDQTIASSITDNLSTYIYKENEELINAFQNRADTAISAVQNAHTSLQKEVSTVLDRIEGSGSQLQEQITTVLSDIHTIDSKLRDTTQSFADNSEYVRGMFSETVAGLNNELDRFNATSDSVLNKISCFGKNFCDQAQLFDQAIRTFDTAHTHFSTNLTERESSFKTLSSGLLKQTDKIEKAIQSFEFIIKSTIQQTETATVGSVEKFLNTLSKTVDSAVDRFSNATQTTKSHLSSYPNEKNFFEHSLKNESLKKSLQEQAHALEDLSIAAAASLELKKKIDFEKMKKKPDVQKNKLNNVYSFSESQPSSRALLEKDTSLKQAAAATSVSSASSVDLNKISTLCAKTKEEKDPDYESFKSALKNSRNAAVEDSTETESTKSMSSNLRKNNSDKKSWVSSLLARASEKEAEVTHHLKSNTHEISIASLSKKIVRIIDANEIAQLWRRYYQGHQNVFSDHCYSAEGKLLLTEIRAFHKNNLSFKKTVNHYLSEFERLLETVQKKHSSFEVIQKYLISDSGKVYTVLAHACGYLY